MQAFSYEGPRFHGQPAPPRRAQPPQEKIDIVSQPEGTARGPHQLHREARRRLHATGEPFDSRAVGWHGWFPCQKYCKRLARHPRATRSFSRTRGSFFPLWTISGWLGKSITSLRAALHDHCAPGRTATKYNVDTLCARVGRLQQCLAAYVGCTALPRLPKSFDASSLVWRE